MEQMLDALGILSIYMIIFTVLACAGALLTKLIGYERMARIMGVDDDDEE